ncbi:MAG: hypothetical protein DLM55_01375 [Acidimicrobiales bacterium]|nr:MAG: hypothetical protein DLM55_01375 [Acidimicrobiales bacterium]
MASPGSAISAELIAALVAALAALTTYSHAPVQPAPTDAVQTIPSASSTVSEAASSQPTTVVRQAAPSPSMATPSTQLPSAPIAPAAPVTDSQAQQVLQLVNRQRSGAGCAPVQLEPRLTQAASAHSRDMANRRYFDHQSPDGDSPAERVTKAGYSWSGTGENIAAGQSTPQKVMDSWMHSEDHRKNILNCMWHDMGLAVVHQGPQSPYWTQEFGAPRSQRRD